MTNADIADEAVVIANEIQALLIGRDTVAVYAAIAMVLGAAAAKAERPDLDGLMRLITSGARGEFARVRKS